MPATGCWDSFPPQLNMLKRPAPAPHRAHQQFRFTTAIACFLEQLEMLKSNYWPGNVRELKHVIMRAVLNSSGSSLQLTEPLANPASPPLSATAIGPPAYLSLEEMERQYIAKALAQVGWKIAGKGGAAEILDINPDTLRSRMRKLGIRNPNKLNRP